MSAKKPRENPLAGYSMDDAYAVKGKMPGAGGLVDLEYGGYGIPITRSEGLAPPSKTEPIVARIPAGLVSLLPGRHMLWRIVDWVQIDDKYRRKFVRTARAAKRG